MGSFCGLRLIGLVNSSRTIRLLDCMEGVCSSSQKKCTLNIKYTGSHLSFNVLLDESEEKVCSFILDNRDEIASNFTMVFSCRNKILSRDGTDPRRLVNQIIEAADNFRIIDSATSFSTLSIDFLVGETDKEASVSCTDDVLSVTLNAKQHPALPSDGDLPTRIIIPSEVLYHVLVRFTGELVQVVGRTLRVRAENGRLVLSIRGTELRRQLDAGNDIQVQGQLPVQAGYDLYRVWYLASMLRREHGKLLVNAVFMWNRNTTEHKLSFQVRSESGEALGSLIIY